MYIIGRLVHRNAAAQSCPTGLPLGDGGIYAACNQRITVISAILYIGRRFFIDIIAHQLCRYIIFNIRYRQRCCHRS